MKKVFILMTILLLSLSHLLGQPIPHVFNPSPFDFNGPNLQEAMALGDNCFLLTETTSFSSNNPSVAAGIWDQNQLDLNNNNDITINFNISNTIGNGGDGLALVFQNQGITNVVGAGTGLLGIPETSSLAVEVDLFDNSVNGSSTTPLGDIPANHVALVANGNLAQPLNGPINAFPNGASLEDGNDHILTIMWRPLCSNLQQITVFIDGRWQFRERGDFINTIFGGNSMVNWGVVAAKGFYTNNQSFCFQEINVTAANMTTAVAQIEDAHTVLRSQFICGEDVFLNGSAATNYNDHRIQIRRRSINSAPNAPYSWVGSMPFQGNINTVNLSELAAQNLNFTFDSDQEYHITLVVESGAPCNWVIDEQTFTVIDGGIYEANFQMQAIGEFDETVTVNTIAFDQTPNTITVAHQWKLYYAGANGENNIAGLPLVPGYPAICCNSTSANFQGLDLNTWYYIKHGIWNECTGWKEKRRSFSVNFQASNDSEVPKYEVVYGPTTTGGQSSSSEGTGLERFQLVKKSATENQINLSVFPNPISQDQELMIQSDFEILKFEMLDTNGRVQHLHEFSGMEKQVSIDEQQEIQTGIYFIRIYLKNGATELRKLMIH